MELDINRERSLIMHIDLNSCFAIMEQQANPLLRHRPVAVAAYDTPRGIVLAASYDAKAKGVRVGVTVGDAKQMCPGIVVMMPDPDKYFDAHNRFREVLLRYTSSVFPKSIDEFVIDFSGSPAVRNGFELEQIGRQIKQDISRELGSYVTVNIGISTNRFLAKLAAGLHKPDGMDQITADNLREVYGQLELIDLPGINRRYSARLELNSIQNPLQFLDTPVWKLKRGVFHGIVGYYWYLRLRGYEIDGVDFGRKSFGQQYAIGDKTADKQQLARLLMKLCEKAGRRMRRDCYEAHGVHFWLSFEDRSYWAQRCQCPRPVYSTQDIFHYANKLLNQAPIPARATNLGVTVFNLKPVEPLQLGLFDNTKLSTRHLAYASDKVNDRYGEFSLVPALMANMEDLIIKRVAFGHEDTN